MVLSRQTKKIHPRQIYTWGCLMVHNGFCHYDTLGIDRAASKKDIRIAYLQKTKEFHPDMNPDDTTMHEKFVKVTKAYEVLGNETMRTLYNNSTSHLTNAVTRTHAQRRGATTANPFGDYVNDEDPYEGWTEEMKQKMYEDFYENTYPEYLKTLQKDYDTRRRRNRLYLLTIVSVCVAFGTFNFTRIMSFHEGYQERTDKITAQNAAFLADRRTGYRAYIKRRQSKSKLDEQDTDNESG